MNYMKIRAFCSPFRTILGIALIAVGFFTSNPWFYLGVLPFVAGVTKFCPLCSITKKCDI